MLPDSNKMLGRLLAGSALLLALSACGDKAQPDSGDPTVLPDSLKVYSEEGTGQVYQPVKIENTVHNYVAPEAPFRYDVAFEYDPTDFCNPERGPYSPHDFTYSVLSYSSGKTVPYMLSTEDLEKIRNSGNTLQYFGFYLCDFVDKDISEEALAHMRELFDNLRQSGTKAIIRYAYSYNKEKWPVTDPPVERIVAHIKQLGPLWHEYQDVIYLLQCGFTGIFGEWHTTTNITTEEQRAQIVKAELDALPVNRQVAIRTVSHKRQILRILNAGTGIMRDTINVSNWNDLSYASRIGFHNDCVFCNSGDGGSYGSEEDRKYVATETNYLADGGESSYANINDAKPYCECKNAYPNLQRMHFSYLSNHSYFRSGWDAIGCGNDIASRVGYRLVLNGAAFKGDFTAGGDFSIRICISNYGFASLINERKLEWVLQNADDPAEKYVIVSRKDPREWRGGKAYVYEERFVLPQGIKSGASYVISMNLPDVAATLHDDPRQSVRLAIKGSWDPETGYNRIATLKAL